GPFSFSVTLFQNGSIIFAYDTIPRFKVVDGLLQDCYSKNAAQAGSCNQSTDIGAMNTRNRRGISKSRRDVVVGLSDAYLRDYKGENRKHIVEYTTINIPLQLVQPRTIIVLTPLPRPAELAYVKQVSQNATRVSPVPTTH
uniref:Pep_M12B_propep domain-containing protein n=1 Tax=Mesocestoides corti TaxID=53468 RepID=A0A5K3FJV8_MESCO